VLSAAPLLHAAAGPRRIRFGVISDVHKDIMHDADERLSAFVRAARKARCHFVIQLGDFCRPYEKNRRFLEIWNSFPRASYHVLGNHEKDGGFSWDQVLAYLGMKSAYYSFDAGGWHFVVLNGNERAPENRSGYPRYVSPAQLDWLAADLARTGSPTLVFSHQSLIDEEGMEGIENGAAVRSALERAKAAAGWTKVTACFNGHTHIDFAEKRNGIHYVHINSASNSWLGSEFKHIRYSEEIDREYPYIKFTAPYREPVFALVTLHPEGRIEIKGRRTEFVGPSPWELGMQPRKGTSHDPDRLKPQISDRVLQIASSRET